MGQTQFQAARDGVTPSPKRRSGLEQVVVWSGILVLFSVAILEWGSRYCYAMTLGNLAPLVHPPTDGSWDGISAAEVKHAIVGFCFQTARPSAPSNEGDSSQAGTANSRTLFLRWPSLFRKLQLVIEVDSTDRAVSLVRDEGDVNSSPDRHATTGSRQWWGQSSASGPSRGANDLVALSTDELNLTEEMRKQHWGALARELLRQSFLITARDEFRLLTLDESLGEFSFNSPDPQAFPFQLNISTKKWSDDTLSLVVQLSQFQTGNKNWAWSSTPVEVSLKPNLNEITELMDGLSRDQFVAALTSAGYQPLPVPAESPEVELAKLESQWDPVSQFTLIRQLHAARRHHGDTAENLAALSRAYARLCNLVEYHWTPMSKVFAARSLLYAQRLQSKFGKSSFSLAHRAYAWSLVGNLKLAIEDVSAARQIDPTGTSQPDWLNLIDQFCHFQVNELARAKGSNRSLALYLRMKALDSDYDEHRSYDAIKAMLHQSPGCARAVYRMCEMGQSLMARREATEGAATTVWNAWYGSVMKISDVPQSVSDTAARELARWLTRGEPAAQLVRLDLIESLRQATSEGTAPTEPSWSLLGEIFSNENYNQAVQVLSVAHHLLGYSAAHLDEMQQSILPGVKGHRFENYLFSFTTDQAAAAAGMVQIYNSTNPAFFDLASLPLAHAALDAPGNLGKRMFGLMDDHLDLIQADLMVAVTSKRDRLERDGWLMLMEICKYQPIALAREIATTSDMTSAKGREFETEYSHSSFLLYHLGLRYVELKKYDDAIRALKRSIAVSPWDLAYRELAELYKKRDDLDACFEALKSCLKLPCLGLEHGYANDRIARILMSQGRWNEARPYAVAAADTYSGWGLITLAECEDGLKNWKAAEKLFKAEAERYSSPDDWYWWCVRTGRGHRSEAWEQMQEYRSRFKTPFNWLALWDLGCERMVNNDISGAVKIFGTRGDKRHQDPRLILLAAVLAEHQGDLAKRDELYDVIRTTVDEEAVVVDLERLFRMATKDPNSFQWHEHLFQLLVDKEDASWTPYLYYCAGEFLANHGQKERALKYLQLAATVVNQEEKSCCLAVLALRRMNEKVGERRTTAHPSDRAAATRLFKKASYFSAQKQVPEAHAILTEAIAAAPNFMAGYIYRGLLNENVHDEQSLADYQACLKIDPDCESALFNLAGIRAASSVDHLRNGPEALHCAQRVVELRGRTIPAQHRMLALAYAECGDFPNATTHMEEAVKQEPDNEKWAKQLELIRSGKPYRRQLRTIVSE